MGKSIVQMMKRTILAMALWIGASVALCAQKDVETLEYLRLSRDAAEQAMRKMEEVEAYVMNVAKSLSNKPHSREMGERDARTLHEACATMVSLVDESCDLVKETLRATEDAIDRVDSESFDESWEQALEAKDKFEKAQDALTKGCQEFEFAREQKDFERLMKSVQQATVHTVVGKTRLTEGYEALDASIRWLR